jgi:hypothetical protein
MTQTERAFKPGIYTHFKEGTKYLAYESTTDEETKLPRISYHSLENLDEKWNRKQEVFMALADQDETNKTGQEFKFEFLTNEHCLYDRTIDPSTYNVLVGLRMIDLVKIVSVEGTFAGRVQAISVAGVIIVTLDKNKITISWNDVKRLYKIY